MTGLLFSKQDASDLAARVKSPNRPLEARMLAKKYYDRSEAVAQYLDLYQQVIFAAEEY